MVILSLSLAPAGIGWLMNDGLGQRAPAGCDRHHISAGFREAFLMRRVRAAAAEHHASSQQRGCGTDDAMDAMETTAYRTGVSYDAFFGASSF
jgi:hypothetical protein